MMSALPAASESRRDSESSDLGRDLVHALDAATWAAETFDLVLDDWQVAALRSAVSSSLWLCSRQAGKSTTAALKTLHLALYRPGSLSLIVSPSQRQSGELFRKITSFFERLPIRPETVEDNLLSMVLENGSRLVSLPSSAATLRGFSAPDLIIEDEAAFVDDEVFHAIRPMLAVSGGRLVMMSTPHGQQGHFYETWEFGGSSWERTRITAGECPRIPRAFLEEERRTLPASIYAQEYECEFVNVANAAFLRDDIDAAFSEEVETWEL